MKCDRCGKNEATFHYKTNINGRVTEAHLCPDCARAMGYAGSMSGRMSSWFDDDWFDRPFRMLEPFFGGFVQSQEHGVRRIRSSSWNVYAESST